MYILIRCCIYFCPKPRKGINKKMRDLTKGTLTYFSEHNFPLFICSVWKTNSSHMGGEETALESLENILYGFSFGYTGLHVLKSLVQIFLCSRGISWYEKLTCACPWANTALGRKQYCGLQAYFANPKPKEREKFYKIMSNSRKTHLKSQLFHLPNSLPCF